MPQRLYSVQMLADQQMYDVQCAPGVGKAIMAVLCLSLDERRKRGRARRFE